MDNKNQFASIGKRIFEDCLVAEPQSSAPTITKKIPPLLSFSEIIEKPDDSEIDQIDEKLKIPKMLKLVMKEYQKVVGALWQRRDILTLSLLMIQQTPVQGVWQLKILKFNQNGGWLVIDPEYNITQPIPNYVFFSNLTKSSFLVMNFWGRLIEINCSGHIVGAVSYSKEKVELIKVEEQYLTYVKEHEKIIRIYDHTKHQHVISIEMPKQILEFEFIPVPICDGPTEIVSGYCSVLMSSGSLQILSLVGNEIDIIVSQIVATDLKFLRWSKDLNQLFDIDAINDSPSCKSAILYIPIERGSKKRMLKICEDASPLTEETPDQSAATDGRSTNHHSGSHQHETKASVAETKYSIEVVCFEGVQDESRTYLPLFTASGNMLFVNNKGLHSFKSTNSKPSVVLLGQFAEVDLFGDLLLVKERQSSGYYLFLCYKFENLKFDFDDNNLL